MLNDLERTREFISRESSFKDIIRSEKILSLHHQEKEYPVFSFSLGATDPGVPVFFLTGGVHGLEKIGAELCYSLLRSSMERLMWDQAQRWLLQSIRVVFVPLLNPVGYCLSTRSNGNGVDLMRNSPIEATDPTPKLLGGHRISRKLPWYRGERGQLEPENQALAELFQRECGQSQCVVSLDLHSGFGMQDRLWFPYSKSRSPFENLTEMHSFTQLFEFTHPYHVYRIEPQSHAYLINGDMWDYLYIEHRKTNQNVYLPLTLEMGSWNWVRKNPLQLFSKTGIFNPIKSHRIKRTFRRHHLLFDFILHALLSYKAWADVDLTLRHKHQSMALERWYR